METKSTPDSSTETILSDVVIISLKKQSNYDKYFKAGNDWNDMWIVSYRKPKSTAKSRSKTVDSPVDSSPLNDVKPDKFYRSGSRSSDFKPYNQKRRTRRTHSFNGTAHNSRQQTRSPKNGRRNGKRRSSKSSRSYKSRNR